MKDGDKLTPPIWAVLVFWVIAAVWMAPVVFVGVKAFDLLVEWARGAL